METLISARSSMLGIPFIPHLPSSSSAGFGFSCNFYPALAGKWPLRSAGGRVSLSSRSDDQIGPLDSSAVDVIAIGSRKDAFIDFCLDSPLVNSSGARFWTIRTRDSLRVQLSQRFSGKDTLPRIVDFPLSPQSCPSATILVASAGHDRDHIAAITLLNAVKSAGGLAIAVLIRPFSFEGQRRQLEVDDLSKKLQDCSIFYGVVETDYLLKTEMETLDEALKSSNNAVLLTISTISALTSELNQKLLAAPNEQIMELKASEVVKLVKSYGEMKVGFGTGYNIKSSITQAALRCPFLGGGLKDINGTVILTLSWAREMKRSEVSPVVLAFRQITGFQGEIIFSGIHEPALEPNLVITTLFVLGCNEAAFSPKRSFLSGLASHFPFLSSLLPKDRLGQSIDPSGRTRSTPSDYALLASSDSEKRNGSAGDHESGQEEEQLSSSDVGPGFNMAQLWAKERAALSERVPVTETERESDKTWTPVIQMQYRGGTYRGRRQGGLPEGKGRLTFGDGSFYDGMWRSGRRCGLGTFCYSNGDVFQGAWRDDLMHGKGWFYFHSGDRWFANFWRGKANGEARFYSKSGSVFFGHFRDGWRHGRSLFIDQHGLRWAETWEDGVLLEMARVE
ncbi:unnamed protein product [Spirodela intermedia]|uniref:Uncharacterized protein n=1 Tax=Spirodela intermedia TaxID=51605 RepID=A0A7I8IYQ4_SPIIN|nr:unnamed protein product [Spirodela intermedia]CAA6663126.1 unnamed protein product [Spirodela intermedia]